MMGKVLKDRRLLFGALPVNLLDRSNLSPMARLLWAVLDSCGVQQLAPSLPFLAVRMGMHPKNKRTVLKYLRELTDSGFLAVAPGAGREGANDYKLTMPDYCWIDSPRLLQLAVKEPVQPSSPAWTAGKGKTSPPPRKKAAVDRVAWNSARQARLDRQRAMGQQLVLQPAADPVSSEHRQDQAPAPDPVFNEHRGGVERTPDPVFNEHPKKETEFKARNKGEGAGPATPPPASLSQSETPAGWADFAQAWQQLHRRPWRWTKATRQLALQVNAAVGDLQLVPGTWRSYLANAYWQAKAHPLHGLVAQVHEHVPASPAPAAAPRCRHQKTQVHSQHTTKDLDGKGLPGILSLTICDDCGVTVVSNFHPDPTPEELAAMEEFKAKMRQRGVHIGA